MAVAVAVPGAVELVHKDELEFVELGMERYLLDYATFLVFMSEVLALLSFSICGSTKDYDRLLVSGGGVYKDICETEQSLSGIAGDNTGPRVPGKKIGGSATVFQCETVGDAQYDDDDEDDEDDGDDGNEGGGEEEGGDAEGAEGVEDVGNEENEEEEEGAEEQGEDEEGGEEDEDDGDEPYEEEEDEEDEEEEENEEDEEPPRKRKK